MNDINTLKTVELFLLALHENAPTDSDEWLVIEQRAFANAVLAERDQNAFAGSFLVLTRLDGPWAPELQHGLALARMAGTIAHDRLDECRVRILSPRELRKAAEYAPRIEEARKFVKIYRGILTQDHRTVT